MYANAVIATIIGELRCIYCIRRVNRLCLYSPPLTATRLVYVVAAVRG